MYRGGNWNNGANAGVFYLNGNNSRSNANTNIGFRAAPCLICLFSEGQGPAETPRQKGCISRPTRPKIHARAALPVEATGDTEQTAQAGRCLLCGQKGDPDPAAWRPQRKDLAEECHNAGHNYDNTRRNEDMDPRNQPSLLERIYSWENLLDAYHEAASEKWYRNDVTAFAANLEENLISIQNDLSWHTYKVGRTGVLRP